MFQLRKTAHFACAVLILVEALLSAGVRAEETDGGATISTTPDAAAPEPVEVAVQGRRTDARRLQDSAEAVTVVDVRKAHQYAGDLGEVLARTQGVGIRREGGLGSNATVSMGGLQGDQVRLFVDGVPLVLAGYPFSVVNVPVNLIERIEVYRGVVPVRFGADALGGAINLVTDQSYQSHLGASYQVGSFGTVRTTVNGRYRHEPTGIVVGGSAFFDSARNDYWMDDRPLPTPDGGTILKSVRRLHDGYRAGGGTIEAGVVDKPWARRLLVQGFASSYDKELQHNALMTSPYGAITYGETIYGATARYAVDIRPNLEFEALANYAHRVRDFQDLATHIYSWEGVPGRPVGRGGAQGERGRGAVDESSYDDSFYGRIVLSFGFTPGHVLRAAVTPQVTVRTGADHVPDRPDLLGLDQRLAQLVSGLEYEANLADERLQNIVFVKDYLFTASAEDRAAETGTIIERHRRIHRAGAGDALRYRFTPWLLGKVSYEYATRLPRADEIYGDGLFIEPSGNQYTDKLLEPEKSHNANIGPRIEARGDQYGEVILDVNVFFRDSKDLIILLAGKQDVPYSNISNARAVGMENAASWTSPGRWLRLDGTLSWQDVRNTSTSGPFEAQRGMRIPSRPYLFASWGARVRIPKLLSADGALEPFYFGRYVHGFDRGWDIGNVDYKLAVPAQLTHSVGLTWLLSFPSGRFTSTFEVDNVANARLYDVYGVQLPGRAFYMKLTGQI